MMPKYIILFLFSIPLISGDELSFEVLDNDKICLYEEVGEQTHLQLNAEVVSGGNRDIDITLMSSEGKILQQWPRTERMTYDWTSPNPGHISICFSNEFSSFTRKHIHFSLVRLSGSHDGRDELNRLMSLAVANVQVSKIIEKMDHNNDMLSAILDNQHHFVRHRTQSAKRAEDLNRSVDYWSIIHTIVMISVSVAQVYAFHRLFSDRSIKNTTKST